MLNEDLFPNELQDDGVDLFLWFHPALEIAALHKGFDHQAQEQLLQFELVFTSRGIEKLQKKAILRSMTIKSLEHYS